ncbi:MAG: ABC transporter ATP-binding protein, partial [Lentisphaeraceae bacterium]|nr:ABC transporter ATP-binding protein [Lentisphaeraceae bacterium]
KWLLLYAVTNRIFGWSQFALTIYATNRGMADLRGQFFEKLMDQSKSFFDRHKVGWLVARGTGDMGHIYDFLAYGLMIMMMVVTYFVLIGGKMFSMAPRLITVCAVIVLIGTVVVYWLQKIIRARVDALSSQNSTMIAYLAESISGVKVNQAFARESHNQDTYKEYNRENMRLALRVVRISAVLLPSMDVLGIIGMISVMSYGSHLISVGYIMPGGEALHAGHLAACVLYMNMLLMPIRMCIDVYNMSISASTAARRIFEVIDLEPSILDPDSPRLPASIKGHLKFENINFRYTEDGQLILDNMSLEIKAGESLAIVGKTGAGKTTIAHLAARFYDPTSGSVSLDGQDLKLFNQDELHANMGIVLQDGFLFSGTVLDNIRFRRPELKFDEVVALCKQLGTHEIINSLPDSYHTIIHEGGETLSSGQRQIISISRALAAEPKVLILDEATSAIDVYTEAILEKALRHLIKNRTCIIIAHRLSTIRHVDRIIVMEQGRIVEDGSHETLLKLGGLYTQMVDAGQASDEMIKG